MLEHIAQATQQMLQAGLDPVLLCSPQARRVVRQFVEPVVPELNVVAHAEVAAGTQVRSTGVVSLDLLPHPA